jgi:hypothetical protein
MYSKAEEKNLKLEFWNTLTQSLKEKGKAKGRNIDWLHYPVKIKDLYFRMEVDRDSARLCIDLQFINEGVREVFFEQFQEFELKLSNVFKSNLTFIRDYQHPNGKIISRIYTELPGFDYYNKQTWEKIQNFLIENFLSLDEFWVEFGEVFHNLK